MRPLERASLEAYGAILLGIVIAVSPLTTLLRVALILVGLGLLVHIVWRSRWTIHFGLITEEPMLKRRLRVIRGTRRIRW